MNNFETVPLCEVVVTAPDPDWLLEFSKELVEERLAASVHHFTPVQSVYRWNGLLHVRSEGRASLHTRSAHVSEIVRRAKERHPYQVPSISARPIVDGSSDYLNWIKSETELAGASDRSRQP
ncbi:divalent-cation tolerance protein CutA [Pseudonocardia alni]|uniref:divalent-cation tolerance protein CutA n=1 Tax=Pseudonocardia alni TaxID=33907 RepID=UPI0036BD5389